MCFRDSTALAVLPERPREYMRYVEVMDWACRWAESPVTDVPFDMVTMLLTYTSDGALSRRLAVASTL